MPAWLRPASMKTETSKAKIKTKKPEVLIPGIAVSHGVAIGPVYDTSEPPTEVLRRTIAADAVDDEKQKLAAAVAFSRKQIAKLIPLESEEQVVTQYGGELGGVNYAFFITKGGVAKRIELSELADSNRPRRVITLDEGDEIAQVRLTTGKDDLLLMTAGAQALRVPEEEFRAMGRSARGVRGMRLFPGDTIISCDVVNAESHILILSERGVAKRSRFEEFTPHHRGTSGVRAMNLGPKTGRLVGCWAVREQDEVIAITTRGRMIRVAVHETPLLSRTAMGNITVRLDEGDTVADCSIVRLDEVLSLAAAVAENLLTE